MLELKHVTKYYRNVPVVDDVTFTAQAGAITGYLGPNGSGKSTTVRMIIGLVPMDGGKVYLDGHDVHRDLIGFRRRLGYVPEEAVLYPHLTGLEYLQLMGRLRELPEAEIQRRASDLLQLLTLHPHRHGLISTYSKGMRQRILIGAALLHNPDVLILDEPLSGLDVASALLFRHVMTELGAAGRTILYISHVLEVVERVCSKVVVLYKGKLMAEGSIDELRRDMRLGSLEEVFEELTEQRDLRSVAREVVSALG